MRPKDIKYLSEKVMSSGEIPLLWGHFGVGKTDIAKEIARQTGRELIILVISQMEPGDLIGMPSRYISSGRDSDRTVFLKPDWWPDNENTIIMIDEVNRAHRSIRNAVMQLLLDRRIHNHILPCGTWIMAAANPPDEEYDQVDLITDPAFMSRFFHFDISPDIIDWTQWAKENKLADPVINFVNDYPEYLSSDLNVSMRLNLRPSPRSWYKLARVFENLSDQEIKEYGYIISASIIGPEAARAFTNHLNNKKNLPTAQDILKEGKYMQRLSSLNQDEKITLVLRINKYIESISETDMIKIIDLSEHQTYAKNIKLLSEYVPKDSVFAILRNLENLIQKSSGLKRAFYDKLFEAVAVELNDESWFQNL